MYMLLSFTYVFKKYILKDEKDEKKRRFCTYMYKLYYIFYLWPKAIPLHSITELVLFSLERTPDKPYSGLSVPKWSL